MKRKEVIEYLGEQFEDIGIRPHSYGVRKVSAHMVLSVVLGGGAA